MILIRFLLIFSIFCLFSNKLPEYEILSNLIFNDFAKEAKETFQLRCEGDRGSMPHDVESLGGFFYLNKKVTMDEARELEFKMLTLLQKRINENEKIRPFLREYPFPLERIHICLSFYDENNRPWTDGSITFLGYARNKIYYDAYDAEDCSFIDLKDEPIEEAIAILKEQNKWTKDDDIVLYKTKE